MGKGIKPIIVKNLETINKLIHEDLIFVDYRTPRVVFSYRIYRAFMDDELKKMRLWYRFCRWMGWMKDDARLINLLKNIRLYINMLRSSNGFERIGEQDTLEFQVASIDNSGLWLIGRQYGDELTYR